MKEDVWTSFQPVCISQPYPVQKRQPAKNNKRSYERKDRNQGWNLNRNCLPFPSSRTLYKNRAMVSCSASPALLKCLRTAKASWSLLTRSWLMMRCSELLSLCFLPSYPVLCFRWWRWLEDFFIAEEEAEEVEAESLLLDWWDRWMAIDVGERRPIPWERRMWE